MFVQTDFTAEEWNIILQSPAFVILYIIQADYYSQPVTYRKVAAGIKAVFGTKEHDVAGNLVRAVRDAIQAGQRPIYPDVVPENLANAHRITLRSCQQVAFLLAQRIPDIEATAFIDWLLEIGAAVAAVPIDPLAPGQHLEQAAENVRTALETLEFTLNGCAFPINDRY